MDTSTTPVAPVHLDALPLGDLTATPWSIHPAWFIAMALLIPALAWLAFAWKRALDEDPHRIRRRGRRELQRLLKSVGQHGAAPAVPHLYAWRRATARTWGLTLATPTPVQIVDAAHGHAANAGQLSQWSELWRSTERGLFAADGAPPADWLQHATSAANDVVIPKRERWFPNRLRHWLPFLSVALCAVLAVATPRDVEAQMPLAGEVVLPPSEDLAPARAQAEQALERDWNDWAAHYNVSAANLQQQKWNAAVAHGTIAFLQHPASRVAQDNLRFALTQVQNADPRLQRLLSGSWYERIASLRSPAQWQRIVLFACLLVAAALTAAVAGMYLPRTRGLSLAMRGALVTGLALLVVSLHGWSTYGRLGDPRAGILVQTTEISPEPSDLTPREKMSPAAAGTIIQGRRDFLSWKQVQVREELTGWVRDDAVLPFYAAAR